jgi:hypothetical protein
VTNFICGLASVALAIAILSGCGDGKGDGTSSASPGRPSIVAPDQFVAKAKSICASANEERSDDGLAFLERRERETGEPLGLIGEFEVVRQVVAPSLWREIERLEAIGLPKGKVSEAEAIWQTLRIVAHEVEVEGLYAWRSAKLLPAFRNRAKQFGLDNCVIN